MRHSYLDPLVSIIVTTKNEEKLIGTLLESITKQTYQRIETIIVDNNSLDHTKDIALKFTTKVYNFGPERSAQRNYGAKKAKGRYFLFLDADMVLSKEVVAKCVEICHSNKMIGGVAIPEKSKANTFWEKVKAFERSFYNERGDPITDAARFFPREVFYKAKGYDEAITGPEDWDLPETIHELGFRIERIKVPIYHHERVPSPFHLVKKKFYYAISAYKYLEKHKIPVVNAKTIYFLRPVFYKNWKKIISNPTLSLAMFFMLTTELIGGAFGYIVGKVRKG